MCDYCCKPPHCGINLLRKRPESPKLSSGCTFQGLLWYMWCTGERTVQFKLGRAINKCKNCPHLTSQINSLLAIISTKRCFLGS